MYSYKAGTARVVFAALLCVATASAQSGVPGQPSAQPARPAAARPLSQVSALPRISTGTVVGTAWRGDTTPYPQARIRLRDVTTGRGAARTIANVEGAFRFEQVVPGAYVVELLSTDDKVLAVGELFGLTAGTQIITFVRLSSKAPWVAGFFGNAAAAVIAAASTLGVTATGSNGQPVSPQ